MSSSGPVVIEVSSLENHYLVVFPLNIILTLRFSVVLFFSRIIISFCALLFSCVIKSLIYIGSKQVCLWLCSISFVSASRVVRPNLINPSWIITLVKSLRHFPLCHFLSLQEISQSISLFVQIFPCNCSFQIVCVNKLWFI